MPYQPKEIADRFLKLAADEGKTLTPMKVQKLVFFAQGWHLAITGQPLFTEPIQAWQFGPVIPSLYREFREFGNREISVPEFDDSVPSELEQDWSADPLIKKIWSVYGKFDAIQLSNMTHKPGSPWHQIYMEFGEKIPNGTGINPEEIRIYFSRLGRSRITG